MAKRKFPPEWYAHQAARRKKESTLSKIYNGEVLKVASARRTKESGLGNSMKALMVKYKIEDNEQMGHMRAIGRSK